jgi:hypothetical protein
MNNKCIVHLSPFSLKLKLVSSILPHMNSKFNGFFLIFSKITFFHLMLFICMVIAVILDFYICLIFSTQIENRKIYFYIKLVM